MGTIKNIQGFINTAKELELIELRLKAIDSQKEYLQQEKERLLILQKENSKILLSMETSLKELKGIENRLFYEICCNGLNVTKAVDRVSILYDVDVSTIWKNYYPKVKKEIERLKISTDSPV